MQCCLSKCVLDHMCAHSARHCVLIQHAHGYPELFVKTPMGDIVLV